MNFLHLFEIGFYGGPVRFNVFVFLNLQEPPKNQITYHLNNNKYTKICFSVKTIESKRWKTLILTCLVFVPQLTK